jgi:hypothetical protein
LKKRKTNKQVAGKPSLLELLDQVEAEMQRLRAENRRLMLEPVKKEAEEPKVRKPGKPPALGKGLAQLFWVPKRG